MKAWIIVIVILIIVGGATYMFGSKSNEVSSKTTPQVSTQAPSATTDQLGVNGRALTTDENVLSEIDDSLAQIG